MKPLMRQLRTMKKIKIRDILFYYYYTFYSIDVYVNRLISKGISLVWKRFRKSEKSYLDLYEKPAGGLSSIYAGGLFIGFIYILFISVFNFTHRFLNFSSGSSLISYLTIFIIVYLLAEKLVFAGRNFSDWLQINSSFLARNKNRIYTISLFSTVIIVYVFFISLSYSAG